MSTSSHRDAVVNVSPGLLPPASRTDGADSGAWRFVAALEVVAAGVTVVFDLWVPTLILIGLAIVSLLVRRQGPRAFGLGGPGGSRRWWPVEILGFALFWTVFTIGLTIPVLEHLTGQRQDVSQFIPVQGNAGLLAVLLAYSWTLAAVGEEFAYRGFLLTRLQQLIGGRSAGGAVTILAALGVAVLFGWAHNEQGVIGAVATGLDALFFSWLRFQYRTLWAAVLAHGFNNSIGLVAYFFVGPIYGLW